MRNFIGNGAGPTGDLVDGDIVSHKFSADAATGEFIADVGDVDRDHVHRYAADDRTELATDHDLRRAFMRGVTEGAGIAIAVTDTKNGDAGRAVGTPGLPITDAVARLQLANL